ncbi:MBOAT family protein [Luteolibacter yonseiensis]|uniref:MBOAT family protein n=1 Tax=Luteolibacter yonseiensis TaxID=1144680 RepID=A0A934R355_9BACT|nr:MBOAT family protein [Luteolibacter yonseiensis]MBK1814384.1 MBOAT family protein [Luteolibacter yonseiensis]
MNFASYDFWKLVFLCFIASRLLIGLARLVRPDREILVAKLSLAFTGLILLGEESALTLIVFLWVVGLSWIGVLLASRRGFSPDGWFSKLTFVILLLGQLAPLFYYKYWDFVMNEWLGLNLKQPSVLIPMGLSFYTFQKIGFWIDTIRNPGSRPKFLDYLNFCSFFPQIVAGPIEKRGSLLPQLENTRFRIHRENLDTALQWIVLGLAYKLIVADNIGSLARHFILDPANAWHVWFESLAFGIRIYFDFAGYSFIALGLGLLFGVRLTLNFRCPYWSTDLREFWRNWHITLGTWLRDYVYLPLGGRRSRYWIANILIVFLISGIWHGAGWGFIIWGLLHGIGVAFCGLGKPLTIWAPLRWAVTFGYTTIAWLFFLERDPHVLLDKAQAVLSPASYSLANFKNVASVFAGPSDIATTALIFLFASLFLGLELLGVRQETAAYHHARRPVACMILVFLTILLAPMEESSFIYFNF